MGVFFREACQAPFVEPFCYGTREDEWVVAHCGPIKVAGLKVRWVDLGFTNQ